MARQSTGKRYNIFSATDNRDWELRSLTRTDWPCRGALLCRRQSAVPTATRGHLCVTGRRIRRTGKQKVSSSRSPIPRSYVRSAAMPPAVGTDRPPRLLTSHQQRLAHRRHPPRARFPSLDATGPWPNRGACTRCRYEGGPPRRSNGSDRLTRLARSWRARRIRPGLRCWGRWLRSDRLRPVLVRRRGRRALQPGLIQQLSRVRVRGRARHSRSGPRRPPWGFRPVAAAVGFRLWRRLCR